MSVDVADQANGMFRLEHANPSYPFHVDRTYSAKDETAESNVRYWRGGGGNETSSQGDMVRRHPVLIQHVLSGEMLLRRIEANR